ncbi:hypothetical protein TEA_022491 [Camellia sinensis var. sinensis]|uniref:Homeobox domain-containing protein n=1 Tax=Camellia sinensis var. sinensis TaxID=542762 RepID=A0A4S4EQJ9_CAMSN|nr:hypothetical protein TEA_022491 [Camellia sinensis var. sinensis]
MWMIGYNKNKNNRELISIPEPVSFNGGNHRPLIPWPCPCPVNVGEEVEQSKREWKWLNRQEVSVVSSRWNPTPEQLEALEELYRRGIRTPSADQIHHITAQLRQYGKIEGKNVFYWFQNHKARDRYHKRRRQVESASHQEYCDIEATEKEESEASRRTGFEQIKNWAFPINCSTFAEPSSCSPLPTHLINNTNTNTSITMDPAKLKKSTHHNHQDLKMFIAPATPRDDQTLQLFPRRSNITEKDETAEISLAAMNPDFTPYQFFEFLPLKN